MNDLTTEYAVTLEAWNCTISVIMAPGGAYLPLRQLCAVIGIADPQQQAEQLSKRRATRQYVEKLPIMTARGKRKAWCIHRHILGYWLGYINEALVRPEIADNLIDFQQSIVNAADRLLFREVSDGPYADEGESTVIPLSKAIGRIRGPVIFPDDED